MRRDGHSTRAGSGSTFEGFLHATMALQCGFQRPAGVLPLKRRALETVALSSASAGKRAKSADARPSERETAVQYVTSLLRQEVLIPLLRAETRDEFTERLFTRLKRYDELMTSLDAMGRAAVDAPARDEQLDPSDTEAFAEVVGRVMGDEARLEADFAMRTAARCFAKAGELAPIPPDDPRFDQDRRLVEHFRAHVRLCAIGIQLLWSLAYEPSLSTEAARKCALELLRAGALGGYATAAEALSLRQPPDEDLSPLPWDEEDEALASGEG